MSDSNIWKYNGHTIFPIQNSFSSSNLTSLRKILVDSFGNIWIGTKNLGLLRIENNKIEPFIAQNNSSINSNKITAICDGKTGLWVATDKGLNFINSNNEVKNYKLPRSTLKLTNLITSIADISEQELLIGTQSYLFTFNKLSHKFTKHVLNGLNKTYINIVYKDYEENQWVGTDTGVFTKEIGSEGFKPYFSSAINFRINSITIDDKSVWLGSGLNGLYRISKHDSSIINYRNNPIDDSSISGNSILTLLDDSKTLFISSFHGGINYFDTKALIFGLENNSINSIYCAKSEVFYNIDVDESNNIWVSSEAGLIEYQQSSGKCINYHLNFLKNNVYRHDSPFYSFKDSSNRRWITSSSGISSIDKDTGLIDTSLQPKFNKAVLFMLEKEENSFVLGTRDGLYTYKDQKFIKIHSKDEPLLKAEVHNYQKNKNNYFFATNSGVAILDNNNKYSLYSKVQSQLPTTEILSLVMNDKQDLWVGTYNFGLFKFNKKGDLIVRYDDKNGLNTSLSIFSILSEGNNSLWMGTNNGLIHLNLKTNLAHTYHKNDGLQGDYFLKSSSFKTPDGKLYFGGRNGFNSFYPEQIKLNISPPNIVLTNFTRFGKPVESGVEQNGFLLKKNINDLKELTLTHNDYVIGFEFSALDFADPSRNKYAYMMEGLDPEWIYTNADNRRISYSNLKPGEYTFRVKGSNKDGVWNEKGKSLKVVVKPAPWFSWWAYIIYSSAFFLLLSWYINRKNQTNKRITKMLRIEVAKQTKDLKTQKTKVESLLAKKNELFANVSHEFRTPLTLILGPINKLLKTNLPITSINDLKMVNRNANRLLTMIEQMLQLAKVSSNEKLQFFPLETKPHIFDIVKSFTPLAQQKRIKLSLNSNVESAISTTIDALDIILGNLLSNAIKYTQTGGEITVTSDITNNRINISVKDTGSGLDQQQQKDIFNRFKRLDLHQNIQGIGIGLSVVESLLNVNNASMQIVSKPGEGSTFTVSFNTIEMKFEEPLEKSESLLLRQLTVETTDTIRANTDTQPKLRMLKENILIIEDNDDMRAHIADTLKDTYHCLLADRGKAGIEIAIKHVPDIIICDVMMPEMDGFQVSRVMRSDTRTSHIPLILLTALHDRESRIKGWREHVDVYLTKPFDAQELLIQIENVLVIRNILKRKAGQQIIIGENRNSDLPKRDQLFVNKLNQLIVKKYKNPLYLRPQLASDMAVSERQLQRKLKALIDKNPMDLLREYRLSQAANMLKEGYQVGVTSDACGFNSVAYFSQCFKAQFGLSPKVYQTTCK